MNEKVRHGRLIIQRQRDVEGVVLAALIDAHPNVLTESAVRGELTSVENTPDRGAAIGRAVEGLVDVGLIARAADLLRLTPAALRAGELDMGLTTELTPDLTRPFREPPGS